MARPDKAPQFAIAPILEYLGVHVPPPRGGFSKVVCKWHDDSTPSASVGRYSYKCFGCDKTGDAISLIREEEDCSYQDALRICAELTGSQDQPVSSTGWGGSLFS